MLKSLAILAIVLAVVVTGEPDKAAKHKKQATRQSQPSVIAANSIDKQASGQADQSKSCADSPNWYAAIKRPEWWAVVAAFATCFVVMWQSYETRRAAQAGLEQAKITRDKERARISVAILRPNVINFGSDGNKIEIRIENVGPTQAQNVIAKGVASVNIDKFDFSQIDTEDYSRSEIDDLGVPTIIGHLGPPVETWAPLFFPERWSQEIGIVNPRITITTQGEVRYEDIFGKKHVTPFRYVLFIPRILKWIRDDVAEVHPFSQWRQDGSEENRAT